MSLGWLYFPGRVVRWPYFTQKKKITQIWLNTEQWHPICFLLLVISKTKTARKPPGLGERQPQEKPNLFKPWPWISTPKSVTVKNFAFEQKCPPTDQRTKKSWYTYTMNYYSAIKKKNEIKSLAAICGHREWSYTNRSNSGRERQRANHLT